jgi:hypothetical protein
MPLSVTQPVSSAFERTAAILFKPFKLGKWFVLGFCAFLSQLGQLGGNCGNFPGGGPGGGGPSGAEFESWVRNNLILVIAIAAALLTIGLAIAALFTWIQSRGKFMFLDGLAHNRAAVVEPWKAFRRLGNSLFLFTLLFGLVVTLASLCIVGLGVALAWPDVQRGEFGGAGLAAVLIGGGLLILVLIAAAIVALLLEDFVVPTMYLNDQTVLAAWRTAREELFAGNVGPIVLFYLMKILLGLAIGTVALLATCLTCCLAAIPYLGTVILLPLIVFSRCYTLCFIEQFGPAWTVFTDAIGARCPGCGYDLRGSAGAAVCPECGRRLVAEPPAEPPATPPTAPA